jgi:hypothetical protein
MLIGINPYLENRNIPDVSAGHIRYFTFGEMKKLITDHGLKIESIRSDIVNFTPSGSLKSVYLARLIPSFGRSIMLVARKRI